MKVEEIKTQHLERVIISKPYMSKKYEGLSTSHKVAEHHFKITLKALIEELDTAPLELLPDIEKRAVLGRIDQLKQELKTLEE